MQRKFPDENAKLTLDEAAFQRLLAAAYVIQEHNESLQRQVLDPAEFKAADLSEIAETQNLVRTQRLNLSSAARLVAERARKISHADGAAVATVSKRELSYIASCGSVAPSPGSTVPLDQSLSQECVRNGRLFSLTTLKNDPKLQSKVFQGRGIQGFVSLPMLNDQQVGGVLELYFANPNPIDQATLHACALLAGLLNGLIVNGISTETLPRSVAPSPALPSNPLDQLRAELDKMIDTAPESVPNLPVNAEPLPTPSRGAPSLFSSSKDTASVARCWKCGCPFEAQEAFCGLCGAPRQLQTEPAKMPMTSPSAAGLAQPRKFGEPINEAAPAPLAFSNISANVSKTASLPVDISELDLHRPDLHGSDLPPDLPKKSDLPKKKESLPPELEEIIARFPEEQLNPPAAPITSEIFHLHDSPMATIEDNKIEENKTQTRSISDAPIEPHVERPPAKNKSPDEATAASAITKTTPAPQWKSANETRAWLESVKVGPPAKHWLAEHRANLYLLTSAILLILVLSGVGIPASTTHQKPSLGWFDSMLVNLGVAEAPSAPVYLGDPRAKVWVDLHTALYYCSDAESYGKAHGGKFETQRQAQEDQFEPASRHACP